MAIARTANTPCRHGPGCPHDIGPAAASVDGLSAASRLQAYAVDLGEVAAMAARAGVGPVERRAETAEERAEREQRDAAAPAPDARDQRAGIAMHIVRPSAANTPEPPRRWADNATGRHPWRPMGSKPGRETAEDAPVAAQVIQDVQGLPCATCLHAPVCRIIDLIPPGALDGAVREIGPGLRLVTIGALVECDYHLASTAVPASPGALASAPAVTVVQGGPVYVEDAEVEAGERVAPVKSGHSHSPETRERMRLAALARGREGVADGRRSGLSPKQAEAVAQVRLHGGRREAAKAMGVLYQTVDTNLLGAARKGLLPADLYPLVSHRFADANETALAEIAAAAEGGAR